MSVSKITSLLVFWLSIAIVPVEAQEKSAKTCGPLNFSYEDQAELFTPLRQLESGELFYRDGHKITRQCAVEYVCEVDAWLLSLANQGYYFKFSLRAETFLWETFSDMLPLRSKNLNKRHATGCNFHTSDLCRALIEAPNSRDLPMLDQLHPCMG
ncbi:MAG: hypothetical protein P8H62_06215 [Henriciella sp.]|nr:hypothetical protein [Henriciella sp.]